MTLPTWNRKPVKPGSAEMSEALEQAWAVLREAIGGGSLFQRSPDDLLHAVEAAAWLDRMAETGRNLLTPLAKVNGASWTAVAAALGVSPATAKKQFGTAVEEFEDDARRAAEPPPWESVEPLSPMEPPAGFEPTDDDFARLVDMVHWEYTGPLEPAIQWVRAHHTDVRVYIDEGVHVVSSVGSGTSASTTADTEEEAWRAHLGLALLKGGEHPFPDKALPGETMAELKARVPADQWRSLE